MKNKGDTIEVTDNDRALARFAMEQQVSMHGVDLSVPANKAFFEQMVENSATSSAWDRFHANILHKNLNK